MRRLLLAAGLAVLFASLACADPPCIIEAGSFPPSVAWWARPSDTGRYVGYYVGGGNPWPRRADPPAPCEGTWGWDYRGGCLQRNVILGWWHARRYQGGVGAYRTDGPRVLPPLEVHHE